MAVLGRVLESHGFRVAILPQPDWRSAAAWRALGRPRLFYAVSGGNMDSMINHYTANKKRRNDDAYSPGGRIGLRPDRPTPVYAQRCREAFPRVPVVIGGIEASLRRIAHFDYWSAQVRPSMLAASKADLLAFGKGEATIVAIARRLAAGEPVAALRDLRGVAYLLGAKEALPGWPGETLPLPSLEDVTRDPMAFARMTRAFHHETNPFNARRLTQAHGDRVLVLNPPCLPIAEAEMDAICELPGTSHAPTIELMREARAVPGVKRVHIASGIRMDLANLDDGYVDELVTHHVGGHLKVAPEHQSDRVLALMKKPSHHEFETFAGKFRRASERTGKEQYLVPYFIASHPGSRVEDMIELAVFLKKHGYRPRQVQDFIPAPMDIATCFYHTGIDPLTMAPVDTVKKLRDRQTQRALMQFFEPRNWFVVHKALVDAGRRDLIGSAKRCLIPAAPPSEALAAKRQEATEATHVHAEDAGTRPTIGYWPDRKGARRR